MTLTTQWPVPSYMIWSFECRGLLRDKRRRSIQITHSLGLHTTHIPATVSWREAVPDCPVVCNSTETTFSKKHQRWTIDLLYNNAVQMRYGACFMKLNPHSELSGSGSTITIGPWSHKSMSSMYVEVDRRKGNNVSFREIWLCYKNKKCQIESDLYQEPWPRKVDGHPGSQWQFRNTGATGVSLSPGL